MHHKGGTLDPAPLVHDLLALIERDDRSMILSGETLASGRLRPPHFEALMEVFHRHFDVIHAIAYIREPVSMIRSIMQQAIKTGPRPFDPGGFYPNYRARLGRWVDAIGAAQCDVIPFDAANLHDGDLLRDFAARVGADGPVRAEPARNRSLSAEGFALLWAINPRLARHTQAHRKEILRKLLGYGDTPFEIDPDACARVIAARRPDIDWIESAMGCPLPPYRPIPDAVIFRSEDEILGYADGLGVDLDALAQGKALRRHSLVQRVKRRLTGAARSR
ncbi:hypothetical protein roselon_00459 [Roseibacterium elongatum DSM 19469]|uniref:Uncharacterized protein n=2 Tax=Roseicyclus elongatus TaxID=159346 RepID=W8RPI8_9RHOB|nr:hypothetical protein roselon_00459 [Roseibacterium elongatum DSM 19469]